MLGFMEVVHLIAGVSVYLIYYRVGQCKTGKAQWKAECTRQLFIPTWPKRQFPDQQEAFLLPEKMSFLAGCSSQDVKSEKGKQNDRKQPYLLVVFLQTCVLVHCMKKHSPVFLLCICLRLNLCISFGISSCQPLKTLELCFGFSS